MFDWDAFVVRLRRYPLSFHRILPADGGDKVDAVETQLGELPDALAGMLKRFNGAELFIRGSPLLSFFRVSTTPPLSRLDWAPEWSIDKFTELWQGAGPGRQNDWAIAMTNYGGLVLLDADGTVKEWDTGENKWLSRKLPFEEWIERVISEGEAIMAE